MSWELGVGSWELGVGSWELLNDSIITKGYQQIIINKKTLAKNLYCRYQNIN